MNKKIIILGIGLLLTLSLVACKKDKDKDKDPIIEPPIIEETITKLEGSGTESDPYIISKGAEFKFLVEKGETLTGFYQLTNNINYDSLLSEEYINTTFNGTFLGGGKTITLGTAVLSETGLFYHLGKDAVVKDFKVVGHIDATTGSVGVITNLNEGKIENIETFGTKTHLNTSGTVSNGFADGIYSTLGEVGIRANALDGVAGASGIAGKNDKTGIIMNCTNNMNVRAVVGGGGIAIVNYGLITNCYNNGCVGTTGDTAANLFSDYDFSYLGGISGINYGTIKECANLNKVYAQRLPWVYTSEKTQTNYRMNIGGITGDNIKLESLDGDYNGGIISSCVNYGRIHGDIRIGGIAGQSNGSITECFNSCYIGGRYRVGGIVGYQKDDDYGIVDSCISLTRVKSSQSTTIEDADGVTYTVEELLDGKTSENTTTIMEFYCLAKYATHSIYHNNSGNTAPIDPVYETTTNSTTTAAGNASNRLAILEYRDEEDAIWVATGNNDTLIPFNKSWQVTLNICLDWQIASVTFVNGTSTTETKQIKGINVFDVLSVAADGIASKANSNNNMSGILPNTGAPEISVPTGKTLIWTTVANDASYVWDGIVKSDITVYAMLLDNQ